MDRKPESARQVGGTVPPSPRVKPSATMTEPPPPPARASFLQTVAAVAWSFFGVRKGRDMRRDAVSINPVHVIIIGVVMAALLVVSLLLLVRYIIGHAAG